MKVKTVLILSALLVMVGIIAFAAEPVSITGWPNSSYNVTQSTAFVSSYTVTQDLAVSGYRSIQIQNLSASATIYYLIGTSTQAIPTIGWPIYPNSIGTIENNAQINYQTVPTVANYDIRKKIIQK